MRFSMCAAVFAGISLSSLSVASPPSERRAAFERRRVGPRSPRLTQEEKEARKYFHEPGEGNLLGHYDARYYHGVVTDEERTDTQLHMIRAYLDFFREKGLDTWIAHGTLLGWWWNGKRLPWDWDMDTQVSDATLRYLGAHYNQTRHNTTQEGGKERQYLIDVNPWITERLRGDGMNIIDARWIDTSNGLFIDITGLSETKPDEAPGRWSCKNNHHYSTSDLYPMRETVFEGARASVPYSYDRILIEEYQEKALVVTDYEGHAWDKEQKLWIKTPKQMEKERKEKEQRKLEEDERRGNEEETQRRVEEEVRKQKEEQNR